MSWQSPTAMLWCSTFFFLLNWLFFTEWSVKYLFCIYMPVSAYVYLRPKELSSDKKRPLRRCDTCRKSLVWIFLKDPCPAGWMCHRTVGKAPICHRNYSLCVVYYSRYYCICQEGKDACFTIWRILWFLCSECRKISFFIFRAFTVPAFLRHQRTQKHPSWPLLRA